MYKIDLDVRLTLLSQNFTVYVVLDRYINVIEFELDGECRCCIVLYGKFI